MKASIRVWTSASSGTVDRRPVLTAGAQQLVDGLHALEEHRAPLRVEGLVLSGGAGEVPGVHEDVVGEELGDRLGQRNVADVRVAQHELARRRGRPGRPGRRRSSCARPPTGSSSTPGPCGRVTPAPPARKPGNHSTRWRTTSRAVHSGTGAARSQVASSGTPSTSWVNRPAISRYSSAGDWFAIMSVPPGCRCRPDVDPGLRFRHAHVSGYVVGLSGGPRCLDDGTARSSRHRRGQLHGALGRLVLGLLGLVLARRTPTWTPKYAPTRVTIAPSAVPDHVVSPRPPGSGTSRRSPEPIASSPAMTAISPYFHLGSMGPLPRGLSVDLVSARS